MQRQDLSIKRFMFKALRDNNLVRKDIGLYLLYKPVYQPEGDSVEYSEYNHHIACRTLVACLLLNVKIKIN